MKTAEMGNLVSEILSLAGIHINGNRDLRVDNTKFYSKALTGSRGLGEAYINSIN
ncbi:MAG: hypothetical protein ABIT06_01350 [Saprospiraceae bacterium]